MAHISYQKVIKEEASWEVIKDNRKGQNIRITCTKKKR
jgi:hypothetical protein